jgi:hypothetical protein
MSHDVFISYSSKDKNAADAVCAVLERNNIRCWIAPRDVLPGAVWGAAIIGAIQAAKIIVLVFSGAANTSPQIEREVERAISKGIPIIPFASRMFSRAIHWNISSALRIGSMHSPSRSKRTWKRLPEWCSASLR